MNNPYVEKYRHQSHILGPRDYSIMADPVIVGNPDNLKSHLLRLRGGDAKPGHYLYANKWVPCKLILLSEEKQKLESDWKKFCEGRISFGDPRPTEWPPHLIERKQKQEAKRIVVEEEIQWLTTKLEEAQDQKAKSNGSILTHPKDWGTVQLRNGIPISIGPWAVEPDSEGLLRIQDETSPYSGMPVWQFKSQITKPMSMEYSYRLRTEQQEALAENRPRRNVPYPKVPVWNRESDLIEYQDYNNKTIKKLKYADA